MTYQTVIDLLSGKLLLLQLPAGDSSGGGSGSDGGECTCDEIEVVLTIDEI
jgi:hypothetical protein